MSKRKILIIENQQFQFEKIFEYLKKHPENSDQKMFEILPTIPPNGDSDKYSRYINFIDHVRVWVNTEYDHKRIEKAIKHIKDITATGVELILMDHILGGAHHCRTGIDLATHINGNVNEKGEVTVNDSIIPIVFLSKTEHTDAKRVTAFETYKTHFNASSSAWIHKGYFGDEILKKEYFDSRVIPKIIDLLGDTKQQNFNRAFNCVLSIPYTGDQSRVKEALQRIKTGKAYEELTEGFRLMILNVAKSGTANHLEDDIIAQNDLQEQNP